MALYENIGGIIFEHKLVDTLNRLGERAFLRRLGPIVKLGPRSLVRHYLNRGPMIVNPDPDTPIALRRDLTRDAIMVYNERAPGNPSGARNVVRWLLYKPGLLPFLRVRPGRDVLHGRHLFRPARTYRGAPILTMWSVNRAYRDEGRPNRDGVAYIVRKGAAKPRIPETEAPGAIRIDGMSHAEINDVLNRCHTFYSYDEATMYSQYAAVCGCTSVVVPGLCADRAEWTREHPLARYGVAYGLDDTAHAQATRHLVLPLLEAEEAKGEESVRRFVRLTKERFPAGR